jgi:hypothetical protein
MKTGRVEERSDISFIKYDCMIIIVTEGYKE